MEVIKKNNVKSVLFYVRYVQPTVLWVLKILTLNRSNRVIIQLERLYEAEFVG